MSLLHKSIKLFTRWNDVKPDEVSITKEKVIRGDRETEENKVTGYR